MPATVLAWSVRAVLVLWLPFVVAVGFQVHRSLLWLTPDIRLDDQLIVRSHPLIEPVVLEPLVGMRIDRIGDQPLRSLAQLQRLSRREPLEFWLSEPNSDAEPTLVVWAFAPTIPALTLTDTLEVADEAVDIARAVGLEPGDRVLRVNDVVLDGPDDYLPEMRKIVAAPQRLSVLRDRSHRHIDVVVQVQDYRVSWAIFVAGVTFGALGFLAYGLQPGTRAAFAFLLFAVAWSILWLLRAVPFDNRAPAMRQLLVLFRLALPVITLFLLLSFSPLRRVVSNHRLALVGAAFICGGLAAWNIARFPEAAAEGNLAPSVSLALQLFTLVLMVVSMTSDWLARLLGCSVFPIDSDRGQVLRWASLVGFLPLPLYFIFRFDYRIWCELAVILFPIIVGYAIVRRNLFQINELLFESFVYGGLLTGLVALYAVGVASAVPLVATTVGADRSWVSFVLMAFLIMLGLPIYHRLRAWLGRRFNEHRLDAQSLPDSGTGATWTVVSRDAFCGEMAKRASAQLGTSRVRILLRAGQTDDWTLVAATGDEHELPSVEACRPLIDWISASGEDVARDVLDDDLLATDKTRRLARVMNAMSASWAIPLGVSATPIGILAVGDNDAGTNYSIPEVRALRRLAGELAFGVYQADLAFGSDAADRDASLATILPRLPQRIGPYRIERLVGRGGMASVYLGTRGTGQVAVKVLNRRASEDPKLIQRFRRESAILREIRHPNVLALVDFDFTPEPYLVVQYCRLGTVRDFLKRSQRLSPSVAIDIAWQVAVGLRSAHEKGIVHRDINPRNLLRDDGDVVRITDFGISSWGQEVTLTTNELLGTPGYICPEAYSGEKTGWRADQYSLGITVFEMLAGRRPNQVSKTSAGSGMPLNRAIPDLRRAVPWTIGSDVADTVNRMLAHNPDDRFASDDELIDALDSCRSAAGTDS